MVLHKQNFNKINKILLKFKKSYKIVAYIKY